jgi:hypothetical protein
VTALTPPPPGRYAQAIAHIPMPPDVARLPIHPGFRMPLPWFCQQSPPDFRVVRAGAFAEAHKRKLCWITGEPRFEKRLAFVTGPMCVVTGTSAEPPARPEPARYAAKACPFLANPRMRRNEKGLPEETQDAAGFGIKRNPGVAAVLITDSYRVIRVPGGNGAQAGVLVRMGPPLAVEWYAQGRAATRAEVLASITSGLPALEEMADRDGPEGRLALTFAVNAVGQWLPDEQVAA